MSEVKSFNEYKENNTPHIVHEAICISCLHRWVEVRPQGTFLKELECPSCEKRGYVIATGQEMEA
jgi:Zn finger protein HypA/HybF involved in hydrogenase expression